MLPKISKIGLLTPLLLGFATVASANDTCSMAKLAGEWALTTVGWNIISGSLIPVAGLVRLTITTDGNLSAKQTNSSSGVISQQEIAKGNATINDDCTGTLTVNVYGPAGNLLRASNWELVLADNATEIRAIRVGAEREDTPVAGVVTANARRLFADRGNEE